MDKLVINWIKERKNQKCLLIIGAGSLGKMTANIVWDNKQFKEENIAFLDDHLEAGSKVLDLVVLGSLEDVYEDIIKKKNISFVIAIANNKIRKKIAEKYDLINYINIIHPTVALSKFANIGRGNIILPHVSIDPVVTIGNHVILNKNCSIGHDVLLSNFTQVSPGSSLGGYVHLEEEVFLGLGTNVLPNIRIGNSSIIGAGSTVTKNIPAECTAVGTPCKPINN